MDKNQNQKSEQWTTYCAFANAVERPINRTGLSVCDDIYLIRDTITYECRSLINLEDIHFRKKKDVHYKLKWFNASMFPSNRQKMLSMITHGENGIKIYVASK